MHGFVSVRSASNVPQSSGFSTIPTPCALMSRTICQGVGVTTGAVRPFTGIPVPPNRPCSQAEKRILKSCNCSREYQLTLAVQPDCLKHSLLENPATRFSAINLAHLLFDSSGRAADDEIDKSYRKASEIAKWFNNSQKGCIPVSR
jgi:hypothetical protein